MSRAGRRVRGRRGTGSSGACWATDSPGNCRPPDDEERPERHPQYDRTPPRSRRRRLADAGIARRGRRSRPRDPGATGHGQVADDREPDRRCDRTGPDGAVRRREARGAGGGQEAARRRRTRPGLPRTAQPQDRQEGDARPVASHARPEPAEARPAVERPRPSRRPGARLDAYCEAINAPIGASEVSPHEAIGALLGLRRELAGAEPPALELPGAEDWSADEFRGRCESVDRLQSQRALLGALGTHPFFGSRRQAMAPGDGLGVAGTSADGGARGVGAPRGGGGAGGHAPVAGGG